MQEKKDKNTSLVPIGYKGLVRLRKSIAITEKILEKSTLSFFQKFNGELYNTININQETFCSFLLKKNDEVYFINKYGSVLKIDIQNGGFSESNKLYNILNNKKKDSDNLFYNPHLICSYHIDGNKIYISNGEDEVFIYRIDNNSLNIKKLNQSIGNTELLQYYSFLPTENWIYSYCNELHFDEYSQEYSMDVRYIKIFSKNSLELLNHFSAIDDFYYSNLSYSQGYIYAKNNSDAEEYKGKILKQSVIDFSNSFIDAFENSWVNDFEILVDNRIICYSNYVLGEKDSALRIIDSNNNKIIFEKEFAEKIINSSLSEDKSVLALLFNNGQVLIYNIKNYQMEQLSQFYYDELIDTYYEEIPTHIHPGHIFEITKDKVIIGNRKKIMIYR
jgi:hypothetical protein